MKKLSKFGIVMFIVGLIIAVVTAGASDVASISGKQLAIQYIISLACVLGAAGLISGEEA